MDQIELKSWIQLNFWVKYIFGTCGLKILYFWYLSFNLHHKLYLCFAKGQTLYLHVFFLPIFNGLSCVNPWHNVKKIKNKKKIKIFKK
jgi:hypothetical protein